jgi:hypothetical protein
MLTYGFIPNPGSFITGRYSAARSHTGTLQNVSSQNVNCNKTTPVQNVTSQKRHLTKHHLTKRHLSQNVTINSIKYKRQIWSFKTVIFKMIYW